MMLAEMDNPLEEVLDQPWRIGGRELPWMSSQIALMILLGVALAVALPLLARRRRGLMPHRPSHLVEMIVLFVRDRIAAPAMGEGGRAFVPFLATLLVFLLGCNLLGLVPLANLTRWLGLRDTPVGGAPTGSIYVCGALAGLSLGMVLFGGYGRSLRLLWKGPPVGTNEGQHDGPGANVFWRTSDFLRRRRWPLPVAAVAAVPVWLNGFVPAVPGAIGLVLWPVLLVLEIIGNLARCTALCIRLFANMVNGHLMVAVMLGFAAKGAGWSLAYLSLPSAGAGVLLLLLDTMVAIIQAYIFTFLSALYIGLAVYPRH